MNCAAVEWALAQEVESSSAKFLLVAIASRIENGVLCASQAELGRIVKLTDRSVRTALKALEQGGFIKRTPNPGKGAGRTADTISLGQPEAQAEPTQPEKSSTGKTTQAETTSPATGKAVRTKRISVPQQPEMFSAPQPEIVTAEFVDNPPAPCIGTGARADKLTFNTTTPSELYSEPVELTSTPAPSREAQPLKLNGSAKAMPAHQLLANLIRIVDSPALSNSLGLHRTCEYIPKWIADGADFDADIVPAVRDSCVRLNGEPVSTLKYFDRAVRRAARSRLAILATQPNPIEAGNDFDAPRATGYLQVSGGKIGLGSANHMRAVKAARDADERRRMELSAGK